MPTKFFVMTSKTDSSKKIELNSLSYVLALEEAINRLIKDKRLIPFI